jgi:hypothetical protein
MSRISGWDDDNWESIVDCAILGRRRVFLYLVLPICHSDCGGAEDI